jgi:hypothetical protein
MLPGGVVDSIGMGPLSFDCDMARRHGWSEVQIANAWNALRRVVLATGRRVERSHPDLYHRTSGGDVVFIGPDEHGRCIPREVLS